MHKQIFTFLCGIFLLVTISSSTRIVYDNDEDQDLEYRQEPNVRSYSGNPLFSHQLIANNILDDELPYPVNRRKLIDNDMLDDELPYPINRRKLIDNDMLDDELPYPVNRRKFFNLNDLLKRGTAFTTDQVTFQKEMLAAHNAYRKKHCVPALALDDTLSRSAQDYATKLIAENKFQHSGTKGLGENLWSTWSSAKLGAVKGSTPTDSWYGEVKFYDYGNPGFSMATGHFTQVVWKGSQRLGAGIAYSSDRSKAIAVAQYAPPGNYLSQFKENVLKPAC